MEEKKEIFSGEHLLDRKPFAAPLEDCFTCFRKSDDFLRITETDGVSGENLAAVFAQHFWFTKDEYNNRTVCKSCWERIDDFHRFYCQVERAYAPPALAEIKVELMEHDDQDFVTNVTKTKHQSQDETAVRDEGMIYAELLCEPTVQDSKPTVSSECSTDSDSDEPLAKRIVKRKVRTRSAKGTPSVFTCYYCIVEENDGKFPTYSKLKKHSLKDHSKDPVIYCCERRYASRKGYIDHFAKHDSFTTTQKGCVECNISFREEDSYQRHMLVVHSSEDQKQFKCNLCPKAFAVQDMLSSHLNWHQEVQQKNHYCLLCDRYFFTAGYLETHIEKHHGASSSSVLATEKQDNAEESEGEIGELSAHPIRKRGTPEEIAEQEELIRRFVVLNCPQCAHIAETFSNLVRHGRAEHGLKNPSVTCCGKKFSKRTHLYEHCLTKINPDQFKCDLCNKVFKDSGGLQQHTWFIHTPVSERPFKCDVCGDAFVKDYLLKAHMTRHMDRELKRHYCQECDRAFNTANSLKHHMQSVHGEVSEWVCDVCAKQFAHRSLLENHRLTHSKEGLAQIMKQCEKCGKWLTNRKNYLRHKRRTCNVTEPIKCNLCDFEALNMYSLDSHKTKMHKERKTLSCSYCGKEFSREIRLKEHEANHAGIMLYQCPFCPKMCNSNSNMYTHKKQAHPELWAARLAKKNAPPAERFDLL